MQTRNQWKGPRDWKIVATVATVATIGISGLAFANPGDGETAPANIDLQDRAAVRESTATSTSLPRTDFTSGTLAFDSPYDSTPFDSFDSPSTPDSPDTPSTPDSPDSPSSPDSYDSSDDSSYS